MTKPIFRFKKLEEIVEKVKQEHPRASEPMVTFPMDELTALIELVVRAAPSDYPAIAGGLTSREAVILLHGYQRRLSVEKHDAITEVLVLRPVLRHLTQAWYIFRNHPDLVALKRGMRRISPSLPPGDIAKDSILARLSKIWGGENLDQSLVSDIAKSGETVFAWCTGSWPTGLTIDPSSPLHHRLKAATLVYGRRDLFLRHTLKGIGDWFEYVPESMFDDAAANYIQQLAKSEWSRPVLERCVERHGLPAAGGPFWDRIDKSKRRAIQQLIAGELIADFFRDVDDPSGRFRFWKDFVDELVGIAYPQNRERVMLHFKKLVVVEFRDIGNAGYVYEAAQQSQIKRAVIGPGSHSECKNQALAVHRIIHHGNWQRNTRAILRRVIK